MVLVMIHYHGTPFSGDVATAIRGLAGRHAMVSFARTTQVEIVAEVCQSFCFDNGAFSAWKSGKHYDIDGYAEFVNHWASHPAFDWYLIPDSIDGDHNENTRLRAYWSKVCGHDFMRLGVPVWHMHEPLDVLQYFCVAYQRVAIGSSAQYSEVGTTEWWERMGDAMKVACYDDGTPKVKLHGLRMLDPTVFSHLPFSSADSTNVARSIGIDNKWGGRYQPKTSETRALIMMERIESHASASRWNAETAGVQQNFELFG
jgi:hypothetical protein